MALGLTSQYRPGPPGSGMEDVMGIFATLTGRERDQVITQLEREGFRHHRGESPARQQQANRRAKQIVKALRKGGKG